MDIVAYLPLDLFLKLFVAALLGAVIGAERDYNGRPAGLRTNMIIAISSCLFTILSLEAFRAGNSVDRVASNIVVGVGFLGAGALMHHHEQVLGLTTAADIWLVAAIGMAIGTGFYSIGIFVAIVSVLGIMLLSPLSHWLERKGLAERASAKSQHKSNTKPPKR